MNNNIRIIRSSNIRRNVNDDTVSGCNILKTYMRILIVDDDKNSGESLKSMIQYRGHDVTLLDEGMKFVNRMNEETFDIIFMDYHTNELNNNSNVNNKDSVPNYSMNSNESIDGISESDDEITGTYISKLAHECYDFTTPIFAYTGDNSTNAIKDFQVSNFNGVFVKPVDINLINSFLEIMEIERNENKDILNIGHITNSKLKRLSMKYNNFMYFKKKNNIEGV